MQLFKKGSGQSRLIFSVGLVTLVLVMGIISYDRKVGTVSAGTGHNMSGWAWSDNIGWISFNSLNSAPGPDYGVNVAGVTEATAGDPILGDHPLSGYAWSDNIGWISFNCSLGGECFSPGESNFPSRIGGTEVQEPAKVRNNQLVGWARACTVFASGCRGALKGGSITSDSLGGWDGWISLSGTTQSGGHYGVSYVPGQHSFGTYAASTTNAFAWGDVNLGWIVFQPRNCAQGEDPSLCGVILGRPQLGVSCEVSDSGVTSPVTATWTANPRGGDGTYTYSWTPVESYVTCSPDFPSSPSSVSRVVRTTCSTVQTGTNGTVNATVTVTDGSGGQVVSPNCTNSTHGGTGIHVNAPVAGYSISVVPNTVSALFLTADIATTSPVMTVSILPFAPPSPTFCSPVTLRKVDFDSTVLAKLKVSKEDVVFQFSKQTSGDPTKWTYESDEVSVPMAGCNYSPVSLQVKFNKHPKVSGSFPAQIVGVENGVTGNFTINIDKGASGIQEQ